MNILFTITLCPTVLIYERYMDAIGHYRPLLRLFALPHFSPFAKPHPPLSPPKSLFYLQFGYSPDIYFLNIFFISLPLPNLCDIKSLLPEA